MQPPVQYCNKKMGNHSKCGQIATFYSTLRKKGDTLSADPSHYSIVPRCKEHANHSTNGKVVCNISPYNQLAQVAIICEHLENYIGRAIPNKRHNCEPIGKYIIENKCGIMCQNPKNGKWLFLYYHQIIE